jgi:protein-histidine pros-kinase
VPAFGAVTTFDRLRRSYPDYTYREATLNPTNPDHRATDWEADVIGYFRDHPGQKEMTGMRQTAMGPSLYLATPIAADPPCLECHSRPAVAPAAMIATYGTEHGFGWKPGSIVAAQIVSVPMSVPVQKANEAFRILLVYLAFSVIVTIVVLDVGVYVSVIRPLKLLSDAADRISKGETNPEPLPVNGGDEIATVTSSFNRMQVSLAKAFKMLE